MSIHITMMMRGLRYEKVKDYLADKEREAEEEKN